MWTDDLVEMLKRLVRDGLSASQMAKELGGFTRNAVIAKIHRLKISKEWPRTRDHATPGTRRVTKRVRTVVTRARVREEIPREPLPEIKMDDVPLAQRRSLMQLDARHCHWPFGDPQEPGFFFCGAEIKLGDVYCPTHAARAVVGGSRYKNFVRVGWR